jgi:asparagine synthase (glutamine-hydrolysing)
MCGIVGAVSFGGSFRISPEYLSTMRDEMAHRGPDGAGLWISDDGSVGLAHRRLSIIDLSHAADQPMLDPRGRYSLVFNGEIYNHAEIRRALQAAGRTHWQTDHSDTEVLLEAFAEWGIDCITRFRGMFAFGIWDAQAHELWLARDRIGIKPLYYSIHHGRLTFASEIKALLADPEQERRVDEEALYHYLTFLCTPAPQTLFAGIRKLAPGSWARISRDGSMETQRYWDVWDHTTPLTGQGDEEIADRLLEELRTAVRYRKVADVGVGVFLSGGIDSSANAALFSEGEAAGVRTFCVGYHGTHAGYTNENAYARMVADRVEADHSEILLGPDDLMDFVPQMVRFQDEPLADPVCIPLYYVSKLAREHGVKVCQVGEGADELFVGYTGWLRQLTVQEFTDRTFRGPLRLLARAALRLYPWKGGTRYEYLRRAARGEPVFWGGAGAFTESEKVRLLSPELRGRLGSISSFSVIEPIWARFQKNAWDRSPLNWMAYLDLNLRLPELLLMRVDKMSMAVSLEARVPFLDHEFVALALSIPSEVRFRDGVPKAILKRAVAGVVPEEIIHRRKQGFGLPLDDWLSSRLEETTTSAIRRFAEESGLLNPEAAADVVRGGDSARIWCLYNLAMWWESHFASTTPSLEPVSRVA